MNCVPTAGKDDMVDMSALYRELDGLDRNTSRKTTRSRVVDVVDDDTMDWDDETTLAAIFEDKAVDVDEREELAALADQLKVPMTALGQRMRQHLRGAIVPAIQEIKQVHDRMEDEVDTSFGKGILTFDDACKRVEAKALRDEDELKSAYHEMKHKMEKLSERLKDAHSRRNRLWTELEENLEQCGTARVSVLLWVACADNHAQAAAARAAVEAIPTEVEETIATLEKKSKLLEKKGNDRTSKQKMLKGLLDKL
ncbi:hypothetical protein EUX98_g7587 [Antrodiella citrinella]|uniref:Uncharacterized protein n=1 Tax=Antrodiella citrinella TaxID=2447956 RepID=A0A4S4MTC8_9APHY|nr:hypothetical protein EUX98_g7587 [Antrodiella citrinella]